MRGAREILHQLGYVKETPNSIEVDEKVTDPDRNRVASVLAELLMCKLEVEKAYKNRQILGYHLKGYGDKDRYREESDDEFYDARSDVNPNKHRQGQWNFQDRTSEDPGGRALHSWESQSSSGHRPPLRACSGGSGSGGGSYTTTLSASSSRPGELRQDSVSLNLGLLKQDSLPEDRLRHVQDGRGFSANGDHHTGRDATYSSGGNTSPRFVGGVDRQHGIENRLLSSSEAARAEMILERHCSSTKGLGHAGGTTPVSIDHSAVHDHSSSSTYSTSTALSGGFNRGALPPTSEEGPSRPTRGSLSSSDGMEGRSSSGSLCEASGRGTPDRSDIPAK